ncbi:predicted protein [Sclerotinia sclerotiorum 1980 UF-70]|uniref:Uncharacterized protein n=1 Tax=Sclerotinia sclerotiorum (strain ATCC 18683 / 1980 / Ss-1) TaxID=665079 RepID=A7F4Q4_SCLS1|nr:predicted protein [Sclerotinia sclerotiorum 1980 UF-70]EDN97725.1 predicted protein [Sclerotinia sclerotiorum 1980 UF-70]
MTQQPYYIIIDNRLRMNISLFRIYSSSSVGYPNVTFETNKWFLSLGTDLGEGHVLGGDFINAQKLGAHLNRRQLLTVNAVEIEITKNFGLVELPTTVPCKCRQVTIASLAVWGQNDEPACVCKVLRKLKCKVKGA